MITTYGPVDEAVDKGAFTLVEFFIYDGVMEGEGQQAGSTAFSKLALKIVQALKRP
jgi:hypothetical protein